MIINNINMKVGVLITNTGTPDSLTIPAVRKYLQEFLSDKQMVHLPRLLWWPILHGLILPFRPQRSIKLYEMIWTKEGSPMRIIMQKLVPLLQKKWWEKHKTMIEVAIGMNYSQPSIAQGLQELIEKEIDLLVVLPLFPQFSHTTTTASVDRIKEQRLHLPTAFVNGYATHPIYINALRQSVQTFWHKNKNANHLLISFHGIPKWNIRTGDPYQQQCEQTAQLLATALHLNSSAWHLSYQSRFGYSPWLQPNTQELLVKLAKQGIQDLDVVCPGFAVDCLETLEEIAIRGKNIFLNASGRSLRYIPALNHDNEQLELLIDLIENQIFNDTKIIA